MMFYNYRSFRKIISLLNHKNIRVRGDAILHKRIISLMLKKYCKKVLIRKIIENRILHLVRYR
jgi:hypothetical protein